jgi:hypothetical protein
VPRQKSRPFWNSRECIEYKAKGTREKGKGKREKGKGKKQFQVIRKGTKAQS